MFIGAQADNFSHPYHLILFKIHFNIILPKPRFSKWCLPFRFCYNNFVYSSHISCVFYRSQSSHPLQFDHTIIILQRVQIIKILIMQFSAIPVTSILEPNILLGSLFLNIINLCSSLPIRNHDFKPIKIQQVVAGQLVSTKVRRQDVNLLRSIFVQHGYMNTTYT